MLIVQAFFFLRNNFDYRLVADILNDVATFLELLAPLFPSIFLYIVCMASISKVG